MEAGMKLSLEWGLPYCTLRHDLFFWFGTPFATLSRVGRSSPQRISSTGQDSTQVIDRHGVEAKSEAFRVGQAGSQGRHALLLPKGLSWSLTEPRASTSRGKEVLTKLAAWEISFGMLFAPLVADSIPMYPTTGGGSALNC